MINVIVFVCLIVTALVLFFLPFLISLHDEKKKAEEQNKDQEQEKE